MAKPYINLNTQIGDTGISLGELVKSIQDLSNGTGIKLKGNLNKIDIFSDSNGWKPEPLLTANKVMDMSYVYSNSENNAQFCLAEKDGKMYPYCDGFFYQNEGNERCLDTGCTHLLYENMSAETMGECDLELNYIISHFTLIVIITTHCTTIVSSGFCYGNLTHCGWDRNINGDRIWDRGFWKTDDRHIHFQRAMGRGCNGYTGFNECANVCTVRQIWGIRLK